MPMTNADLEKKFFETLQPVYGAEEAASIKRYFFSALYGWNDQIWLTKRIESADEAIISKAEQALKDLLVFKPIQYITGSVWFMNLQFRVGPGVLIPRPETEELVTKIINENKSKTGLKILDIGCGSGAISVSLSKFMNQASVSACDISETALEYSGQNARLSGVKLNLFQANILDPANVSIGSDFDIIVSNPPYVKETEKELISSNVLDYEPSIALFVPDDNPLIFYISIVEYAYNNLKSGGSLWFEINEGEGEAVATLCRVNGYNNVEIHKDFKGKNRFVSCIKY